MPPMPNTLTRAVIIQPRVSIATTYYPYRTRDLVSCSQLRKQDACAAPIIIQLIILRQANAQKPQIASLRPGPPHPAHVRDVSAIDQRAGILSLGLTNQRPYKPSGKQIELETLP